jgi:hypothetical protein
MPTSSSRFRTYSEWCGGQRYEYYLTRSDTPFKELTFSFTKADTCVSNILPNQEEVALGTFYGFDETDLDKAEQEVSDTLDGVAARLSRIVYRDLAGSVMAVTLDMGLNRDRAVLGQLLARIAQRDHDAGRGLRTALVVSGGKTGTFEPNDQFYKWAQKLGYSCSDRPAFLNEQLRKVYQHAWASRSVGQKIGAHP